MKKRVLITGEGSYIGESFYDSYKNIFDIETLSVRGNSWKEFDMKTFDTVFHVAGIAHVKPTSRIKELYKTVNRNLSVEVAKKAKKDGVKQFIFMSSMSVYGDQYSINRPQIINENTKPKPDTLYGISKHEAEIEICKLIDENFKILILRPPMIYGKDAKGNYNRLLNKKHLLFVFPNYDNKRSTISIENFIEFVSITIKDNYCGIYCPVDKEFLNTSILIKSERANHNKKTHLTKIFNPILNLASRKFGFLKKMFGSNYYLVNENYDKFSALKIAIKEEIVNE